MPRSGRSWIRQTISVAVGREVPISVEFEVVAPPVAMRYSKWVTATSANHQKTGLSLRTVTTDSEYDATISRGGSRGLVHGVRSPSHGGR
jgi:hypothetical protein